MLDNLILVTGLGGGIGGVVGFFYKNYFILIYEMLEKIFYKIFFPHIFFKVVSLFFSCIFTFLFFLLGMLFLPIISDNAWNYFYISFFIGILVGVKIERML